ncbi:bifunctional UDP-N-acetylglucosamine diphosphorylase/glucosamine-1-phosphate N-acetyltransferase GlmU, partial [Bacteriovoracaceae bacterium]|nr:bifunctional UDP-N-acetylglucosamine diphosphorylase/glucosamine-1-phosphate N-acetyltransferase GlmU [Bacteriovoracaceae bacterium]
MTDQMGVALLAAGAGTRLKVKTAKPLIRLLGKRLVDFSISAVDDFLESKKLAGKFGVVIGHQKEEVKEYLESVYSNDSRSEFSYPIQEQQLGTADALKCFFKDCPWAKDTEYTLILCADTPLLTSDIFESLYNVIKEENIDGVCATFSVDNPSGYGRIVRSQKGFVIVEHKDSSEEQLKIKEVNSGLYLVKTKFVLEQLKTIDSNNKSNEFYLTDIFKFDSNVKAIEFEDADSFLGVNTMIQLEQARLNLITRKIRTLQCEGVNFINSQNCYIEEGVEIESGATIFPSVTLLGNTKINSDVLVEQGCVIKNSTIAEDTVVKAYSYIEDTAIQKNCAIGPFARLRKGTEIADQVKIGNFVETKQVKLDKNVAISHLSYVGDAEVGENTNLGCGFITCNYDGEKKHLTKIGKDSFIGSDTQMIAPVNIGD